jgi:hypothetical protein
LPDRASERKRKNQQLANGVPNGNGILSRGVARDPAGGSKTRIFLLDMRTNQPGRS